MTRRFLQGEVGEGIVGGAKELRGEVLRENRNNRVVSGDPERSARRRARRMFHVKTLTPTAAEGNAMSCRRRRNPVRSVGIGGGGGFSRLLSHKVLVVKRLQLGGAHRVTLHIDEDCGVSNKVKR